jgi:hypothetical protein
MPPLAAQLQDSVNEALRLSDIIEVAKVEAVSSSQTRRDLTALRVYSVYELSYVKLFYLWEDFLESVFLRYMCGYVSSSYTPVLMPGHTFSGSLAAAEATLLAGSRYLLWHNCARVIQRSQRCFAGCPIEAVLLSNQSRLDHLASIRHRIVHAQSDAKTKFNQATMSLSGKRYRGSRVGLFLRDYVPGGSPPTRWLTQLAQEITGMANQIA